ncbi:MAG TPA: 4,5-DOPA dioxygenase extradiol [Nitrospirota bacterium]|nr:4,5-DOPA dioxygenase extradiol [Nitrospirota bacterium]
MKKMMPAIFVGHGSPMNAVENNNFSRAWERLGSTLPKPKAILSVSAHWYRRGTAVMAAETPRTIHDFGGFPPELYQIVYPAKGDPALAERVQELLAPLSVAADADWGLDHGTWSVLLRAYPRADVPVIQLSIDERQPPEYHYTLGSKLAPLREEGILIMGSGAVVHNLAAYNWRNSGVKPYPEGVRFEERVRELLLNGDDDGLMAYETLGRDAKFSAPTPDHYLPLLYIAGARNKGESISFPVAGFDGGAVSMLSMQVG